MFPDYRYEWAVGNPSTPLYPNYDESGNKYQNTLWSAQITENFIKLNFLHARLHFLFILPLLVPY